MDIAGDPYRNSKKYKTFHRKAKIIEIWVEKS